jgi:hypothetical protein
MKNVSPLFDMIKNQQGQVATCPYVIGNETVAD